VILWAFEKQGLYQLPVAPVPFVQEGAPPAVNAYIDDGRAGQYQFQQNFWETADIWNRHAADAGLEHQTPRRCEKNYAYVRIKNRGQLPARILRVNGYHAPPAGGLVWPDDFEAMTTASLPVPAPLLPGAEVVVGPFEWTPVHDDHESMLMTVTARGDPANTDVPILPSTMGPTPAWRLVPSDNNIALRSMMMLPGAAGRCALEAYFCNRVIRAQNPFNKSARMQTDVVMPPFLASRGWLVTFDHAAFTLGPRAGREVRPKLFSGRDFTAAELAANGRTAIVIRVLANGIVVGGFTYVLDPALGNPQDAKKCCCEPCVDDRCRKCCCCQPPCDKRGEPECEPEPRREPKDCDKKRPCCVRVEVKLDPCECSDERDDGDECSEPPSPKPPSRQPPPREPPSREPPNSEPNRPR